MVVVHVLDKWLYSCFSFNLLCAHSTSDSSGWAFNTNDESVSKFAILVNSLNKTRNNKTYLSSLIEWFDNDSLLASSSASEEDDNSAFFHTTSSEKVSRD